jgi:hypothetical protein
MRKILTASKDTTLYQAFPTNNAGLDEILEIGKVADTIIAEPPYSASAYSASAARSLIYFELPTTASVSPTANYFLNLRLANANDVQRNQTIVVYKVSQSWDEGSGYFYQNIKNVNDGATWRQLNSSTSWSMYGGDFLTGSTSASITLSSYPLQDIRVDVTNILRPIVSQSLQSTFYGLALQFPTTDELSRTNQGNIKVFSTQTHTIHQPTLEIAWDNQTFVTGSLVAIPSLNVKIVPSNLKESYTKGDVSKITLTVRDEYPLRSFDSTLRYKNKYYLPTSSYYSIVDVQSNTVIVDFDDYSKISTDTSGSYVVLDTTPLYKGRFYTLKLKVNSGDYSRVINTDTLFKVN